MPQHACVPCWRELYCLPAFITGTIGLTYDPAGWYALHLGLAAKQTVVLGISFVLL